MEQASSSLRQDSQSRWTAILRRDPAAHCSFYYGVKSTKIYCRPTCTARIARRANVVYFETTEQARQDGFRPCQKCKPDDLGFIGQREAVVLSALDLLRVKKHDVTMRGGQKELAKEVGVTPSYLCRAFKRVMGTTIGEYMKQFENEVGDGQETVMLGQEACNTGSSNTQSTIPLDMTWSSLNHGSSQAVDRLDTACGSATCQPWLSLDPPKGYLVVPPSCCPNSFVDPHISLQTEFEESSGLNFDLDEWIKAEELGSNGLA